MHSSLSFFLAALLVSAGPLASPAKSDQTSNQFTLQVASFPDTAQASRFAIGLVGDGESPLLDTIEIEGRGYWTRVFVGMFDTPDAARRYGNMLVARGVIKGFLVKNAGSNQSVTRPRRVTGNDLHYAGGPALPGAAVPAEQPSFILAKNPASGPGGETSFITKKRGISQKVVREPVRLPLPAVAGAAMRLAPQIDMSLIPRPDPIRLAFRLVTGEARSAGSTPGQQRGGLWLSGDADEGLSRLRWIAGEENAGLIKLDADLRVRFDMKLLAKLVKRGETRVQVQDPLRAVDYISSNEGLLLLVQVIQGRARYLLHIGRQAPTFGKNVEIPGSINLDNNDDSRINRYRKNGRKLDIERPPAGFDALIALNPAARWFNLNSNSWVQAGEIVFHEIAEAYGKLEQGLDYLDLGSRPGAHALALEREQRLKSQRPRAAIVTTTGSNRLLRSDEEIRLFTAEAITGASQR